MTDLTKLTVDQLRAEILVPENGVTFAEATNELARRAQANDLVQAERDEFDEELHTCRAIVRATSEHLHVDLEEMVDKLRRTEADAHSWQELATARAQANDALRSVAQWVATAERDLQASALVNDGLFNAKLEQLQERCGDLREALAAAPAPSSSGAPAPADSQREAAIEAWRLAMNVAIGYASNAQHPKDARDRILRDRLDEAVSLMRSLPPAPVAPVTEGEVEAAISLFGGAAIGQCDEATYNGRKDALRALIARRVEEARGAGLRELRARLLSTAASLPNRQMGHSDEDFDRGYVEACENWAQEIDLLLAAPPASKLAEEPAQEPKPSLSWRSEFADLKRVTHAEWLRHDKLIIAIHAQVESQARRIEALERAAQDGGQ